jgi:hypothetical protein
VYVAISLDNTAVNSCVVVWPIGQACGSRFVIKLSAYDVGVYVYVRARAYVCMVCVREREIERGRGCLMQINLSS